MNGTFILIEVANILYLQIQYTSRKNIILKTEQHL